MLWGVHATPFLMPKSGLDISWIWVINYAINHKWQFGKDIIFTYGPFGNCALPFFNPHQYIKEDLIKIVISLVVTLSLIRIIHRSSWFLKSLVVIIILFESCFGCGENFFLFIQIIMVIFTVNINLNSIKDKILLYLLVMLMAFSALVKFNLFPTGILLVVITDIYLYHKTNHINYLTLLYLFGILIFFIISGQKLQNLPIYFKSCLELTSGYSEAMQLYGIKRFLLIFLLLSSFFFLFLIKDLFSKKSITYLYVSICFILIWFSSFKEGFVRFDGHAIIAYEILPLYILFYYFIDQNNKRIHISKIILLIVSLFMAINVQSHYFRQRLISRLKTNIISCAYKSMALPFIFTSKHFLFLKEQYDLAIKKIKSDYQLPKLNGKIDIYPVDASIVLANGLDYKPRPVFQSYTVYTKWLIEKNKKFIRSKHSADYILFKIDEIDNRLPTTMEGWAWLDILNRYIPIRFFKDYLILKKRIKPKNLFTLSETKNIITTHLNRKVILPQHKNPIWCKISIQMNLFGKILTTLFKAPILQIKITYRDGHICFYRIIPKIIEAGFILSPQVDNINEFVQFAHNPQIISNTKWVKSIEIVGSNIAKFVYKKEILVTLRDITHNKKNILQKK